MEILVNSGLVKIVGVFAYDTRKDPKRFTLDGYHTMHMIDLPSSIHRKEVDNIIDGTRLFYKNTYYSEFRDLMFTGRDRVEEDGIQKNKITKLQRTLSLAGHFILRNNETLKFITNEQELFLFPDGIGIFSISFEVSNQPISYSSNLINQAREFTSNVENLLGNKEHFHKWISTNIISTISIVGDNLEVDEYSGSKFKTYAVFDVSETSENLTYNRDHLLFELGTSSPIGTVAGTGRNKPSPMYYDLLMENKLSAFANYEGLALLDSFTVIGTSNYSNLSNNNTDYFQHHTWNRTYFSIYIFNLYVRYNLFKFNSLFLTNPVKYRNKFQQFLNQNNFTHISFNFLPNMVFSIMRNSLGIEAEIEKFEKRLSNLAASIQEGQEKRQAFLLSLISIISSISAAKDIKQSIVAMQISLGWNVVFFYTVIFSIITILGLIVLVYLFPLHAQKLKKKLINFVHRVKEK